MNKNYVQVEILVDRSGSMQGSESDTLGGIQAFIDEQKKSVKKDGGVVKLSVRTFDTQYDTVFENQDVRETRKLTRQDIQPRGGTSLFDAVGKTINNLGAQLSAMKEKDRPGGVILIIQTDGQENSSKEFTLEKIKEMIKHQEDVYSWQILFLGANPESFSGGLNSGFSFAKSAAYDSYTDAAAMLAGKTSMFRCAVMNNVAPDVAGSNFEYSAQERAQLVK